MAQLTAFQLSNAVLQNGTFTAKVNYQMSFGNFDTTSNTRLRVFWYDNSTNTFTDYPISNNIGTINISKSTSGPYISVSGQCLALPSTLSGNVLQGGTYYPTTGSTTPMVTYTVIGITPYATYVLSGSDGSATTYTYSQAIALNPSDPNGYLKYFSLEVDYPDGTKQGTYLVSQTIANQITALGWIGKGGTLPAQTTGWPTTAPTTTRTTTGQNIGPLNIVSNTSTQNNVILSLSDYGYLVTNTALFNVSPQPVSTTSLAPTTTYTQLATVLGILSKTYTGQTPQTVTINTSNAGTISVTVNGYTGNIGTTTTYSNISVTLKQTSTSTITKTFIIDTASYSQLLISNTLMNLVTNTQQNVNQPTNATIFDIQNFVNSAGNPIATPPPTNLQANVTGQDIVLTFSSQYPVSITMNGQLLTVGNLYGNSSTSPQPYTYSRFGLSPGNYTFTLFASNNGLNSTTVQTTATIATPPPTQTNYAYNIQIPNVSNALRLVTATNYGTTSSISFPARSFVNTILNQDVSTIPNTLNALFITNVGDTPNEVQVANALIGYFPNTPPQPTGPKRSIIEIAGGIFAGLLTLSLITGGTPKKGKR